MARRRGEASISRRGFLQGLGVAAGSAALAPGLSAQTADSTAVSPGLRVLGSGPQTFELRINGEARSVTAEPRATLLDVLRNQLGLTGSKEICDRGACGGCTVLIDGVAVNGCMTLAIDCVGHEVSTIEGLAADPVNAGYIDALCAHDAAQCGFCIPGFVVKGKGLGPGLSPEAVREALAGNICRCGTYTKIFDGMLAVFGPGSVISDVNNVTLQNAGPRVEVREKITGAAKYTADVRRERMLWGKFIRYPFGAGRVTESNVEAARAAAGVVEVEFDASKESRWVGDRLGHVIAESIDVCEDAIEALALRFEEDGARPRPEDRIEAPALEDDERTRLDEALESAAATVEGMYTTQVQTHSSLETHGGVVDAQGERAEAWGSTQACQGFREGLQDPLGMEGSAITFHCEHVGGGFGSKFSPGPHGRLAAEASKRLGRPVTVMNDRRGEHLDGGNRPGSIQHWRLGADTEGKILGGRLWAANTVGFEPGGGEVNLCECYEMGEFINDQTEIQLTAGQPTPFRAPGFPQGCFGLESTLDELAKALNLDPLEFRRRNATSERRVRQLERGAELIGWSRRRPDGTWPGRVKTGFGCAQAHWNAFGDGCAIDVNVLRSGRIEVFSGAQDIGTGTRTMLVDVTAHELGVPRDRISGNIGNSQWPPGPASGGSVTTRLVGTTTRLAARRAKEQMTELVAREWGIEPARVTLTNGAFTDGNGHSMPWDQACGLISQDRLSVRADFQRDATGEGDSSNTQFAEVEVDTEMGVIRVKKIVTIQAGGVPVNRLTFENQMCGGVIQGLSYALFEERVLDRHTGGLLTDDLEWYKVAGPVDIPEIVPVIDRQEEDTGIRPIGEPVTIPTAAAIANAVANALGVRVRHLPMSPRRVLAALEEGRA